MKFGLKLWSTNVALIHKAVQLIEQKKFDYIELLVIPRTKISPFIIDIPYIIHIPHDGFGVNIGKSIQKKYNLENINESIFWADKLNAKYLILHAGEGSMGDALEVLREITDNRILIENMPKVGINNERMIGYSPLQIRELIGDRDMGLCLDFGHAIKAAVSLGVNYKDYLNDFLDFETTVFHISDGTLHDEKDEHLNIGDGEYDIEYLLTLVMKNRSKFVTMETPRKYKDSLKEDVINLEVIKRNIR